MRSYNFIKLVTWPSGKAKVCKTFIPRFKSGRHLQKSRTLLRSGFSFFTVHSSLFTPSSCLSGILGSKSVIVKREEGRCAASGTDYIGDVFSLYNRPSFDIIIIEHMFYKVLRARKKQGV